MVSVKLSAQDLFRAAYENRYTWDRNFPGYIGNVTYKNGDLKLTGQISVSAKFKPEVFEITNAEVQKAVLEQLQEICIHRVRRSFEDTHGKNTFTYGETDETGAVEILIGGQSSGDQYKVRNNEVCKVHRHIHGIVVTIHTFSSHDMGAGYLAHRYNSIYHDPETGEAKSGLIEFEDEYTTVTSPTGPYFVLSRRVISTQTDTGTELQEFIFSNLQSLNS